MTTETFTQFNNQTAGHLTPFFFHQGCPLFIYFFTQFLKSISDSESGLCLVGIVALNEVFGQWHSFVLFFVMLPLCTIGVDI